MIIFKLQSKYRYVNASKTFNHLIILSVNDNLQAISIRKIFDQNKKCADISSTSAHFQKSSNFQIIILSLRLYSRRSGTPLSGKRGCFLLLSTGRI